MGCRHGHMGRVYGMLLLSVTDKLWPHSSNTGRQQSHVSWTGLHIMLCTPPARESRWEQHPRGKERAPFCPLLTQQLNAIASMPRAWWRNIVPWDICPESRVFILKWAQYLVNATIQRGKYFSQHKQSSYWYIYMTEVPDLNYDCPLDSFFIFLLITLAFSVDLDAEAVLWILVDHPTALLALKSSDEAYAGTIRLAVFSHATSAMERAASTTAYPCSSHSVRPLVLSEVNSMRWWEGVFRQNRVKVEPVFCILLLRREVVSSCVYLSQREEGCTHFLMVSRNSKYSLPQESISSLGLHWLAIALLIVSVKTS